MTGRFTPIWGAAKPAPTVRSLRSNAAAGNRGAAGGNTDAESGTDEDSPARSLRALDVMLQRGLIPEDEHRRRREEIMAGAGKPPGEPQGD